MNPTRRCPKHPISHVDTALPDLSQHPIRCMGGTDYSVPNPQPTQVITPNSVDRAVCPSPRTTARPQTSTHPLSKPALPLLFALLLLLSTLQAQTLTLDRLFTRPYLWGTWPSQLSWAHKSHQLGFLWNNQGGAFRDLYTYNADTKKLTRLTDLSSLKDPINDSEAELDLHRKQYIPPSTGLTGFDLSSDGSQAVFSYRGDLFRSPHPVAHPTV